MAFARAAASEPRGPLVLVVVLLELETL